MKLLLRVCTHLPEFVCELSYQVGEFIGSADGNEYISLALLPMVVGVMSLEPRLGRELALLRRRYNMMRLEAGLPP